MKTYKTHEHDHQFEVPARIDGVNDQLHITVNSDLMKQYSPGAHPEPIARKNLRAVKDAEGFPMVFFLNDENELKLAYKVSTFKQGEEEWNLPTISDQLFEDHFPGRKDLNITTFEVSQTKSGHFKLLIEIYEKEKDISHLLTSGSISNKINEDFLKRVRRFENRGILSGKAQKILVGTAPITLTNGKKYEPIEVVSTLNKGDLRYYFWKPAGLGSPEANWREFTLTTTANNLRAIVPMQSMDGYGIYALIERGGIETLSLNVLIDVDGGMQTTRRELVLPPGGIGSIDSALSNEDEHTDLYLGGEGLWVHKAEGTEKNIAKTNQPIRLTKENELKNIKQLFTVSDHKEVTALALNEEGILYRLCRKLDIDTLNTYLSDPEYLSPAPIHNNIKEFHPVLGWDGHSESLILIDEENKIARFEHSLSGWHEKNIPIPNEKKEINEVHSSTMQINIHRKDGQAFNSERSHEFIRPSFTLHCEESIEVLINGKHERLLPNKNTLVYPDMNGKITIVKQTVSPGIPPVILGSPYFEEKLNLNLSRKFERKLHSYKTKEDLENDLVDQNTCESLIPETHKENLEEVYKVTHNIQQIDVSMKLDRGELIDFSGDVNPVNTWRLSIINGNASYVEGDAALADVYGNWFWDALKSAASDVLRWAEKAMSDTIDFIVKMIDDIWHFAIKIGKEIFRFVVKTAAQIYQVFKTILKHGLGIDLDAIFKWIGFLFDWKDVVTTYSVYSNLTYQSFKQGEHRVQELKKEAIKWIDKTHTNITESIRNLESHPKLKHKINDNLNNGRQHESPEAKKAASMTRNSPGGNFGLFQLQNGGLISQDPQSGALITPTLTLELDTFLDQVRQKLSNEEIDWEVHLGNLESWIEAVVNDLIRIIENVKRMVQGDLTNPNDLYKNIENILDRFASGGKALVNVLFDIVGEIFKVFEKILFDVIIPNSYINGLFDMLIQLGGGADLPARSRRLNVVNFFMLVMAIPTTVMFKMVTNRTPFPNTGGMDRLERAPLFKALEGGTMPLRVYKDLSHMKGLTNGVLNILESPLTAISALSGGSIPPYLNLPIDIVRVGCNMPYGTPTISKYIGWVIYWIPLGGNIYGVLSPGPSGKVSSALKIVGKLISMAYGGYVYIDNLTAITHPDFKDKDHIVEHVINTEWQLFSKATSTTGGCVLNVATFDDEPESKAALMMVGVACNVISDMSELCRAATVAHLDLAPLNIVRK
ncbi:hypothetical protein [Dokdonia sp.]|uniref:hypothetical protein n=1 Tax=Dokdonia sp. TaxID=2024995 RepID=UPI0032679BCF